MLGALAKGTPRKGRACPWCKHGVVRRLGADAIDAERELASQSVQLEHSEPVCREFAGAARGNRSRDESVFPVVELERTPPALRAVLLELWKVA